MRQLLLLLAALLLAGVAIAFLGPQMLSFGSTLCTEGADEVRIESNVLDFDSDDAWVIDASAGCDNAIFGGGGTVQAEDVQTSDAVAERDFTLGMTEFEAWFYQGIQDTRNPVYNVQTNIIDCGGLLSCGSDAHDTCDSYQSDTAASSPSETRIEYDSKLYCFRTVQAGSVSDLSLAQGSDFQGTMTAEAGGDRDSDTISKSNSVATVEVGDVNSDADSEKARITWTGSFIGEIRSLDLSEYHATCDNDCELPTEEVGWTPGFERFYQDWLSYNNNGFEQCIEDNVQDGVSPAGCADFYNAEADSVFADASNAIKNQAGFPVKQVRTQNGEIQVVAERGEAVERPDFRIMIDADWIGFDVPVAAPIIFAPDPVSVVGNGQTTAVVKVRNGADLGGEIQLTSDCEEPVSGGSDTQFVEAGEIAGFSIGISAGPSEDTTATCELTAQDTDDESTAYTETLTVNVEASCTDSDGDGVCDKFDACPHEVGPDSGCPLDDDDDDDDGGGGWFTGLVGSVFDTARSVVPGAPGRLPGENLVTGVAQSVDQFVGDVRDFLANPFGDWNRALNVGAVLVAFLLGYQVTQTAFVKPLIENVSAVFGVAAPVVTLTIGVVAGVVAAWIVYALFASFWAKLAVLVLGLAALGVWVYLQALLP